MGSSGTPSFLNVYAPDNNFSSPDTDIDNILPNHTENIDSSCIIGQHGYCRVIPDY